VNVARGAIVNKAALEEATARAAANIVRFLRGEP
jgi:lactate dehydrogenase-like 2-hydroxyacid dehydrogenase